MSGTPDGRSTLDADADAIGRHYDERSPIGDELRNGQIHMWYWYDDDDDAPLTEAVHRIGRKVTDTLGLRPGEHLLDAGCGPGETSVRLAAERGIRVTGLTLSRFEVESATRRAHAAGVSDRATFRVADYTGTPFADGTFDAVLALESLQNVADPGQAFREFFRILRPGGRVSFSDFSLESAAEPERVAKFMDTLRLTTLPTLGEWLDHARGAGFVV